MSWTCTKCGEHHTISKDSCNYCGHQRPPKGKNVWQHTELIDFSFECIQGKPEECKDLNCKSLYHTRNQA